MSTYKVEICGVNTAQLPILKEEEKDELFKKIKAGDKASRETYIKGNLRLVLSVIKRFNNHNENVDDLFQIGCIGLMKAIDNFDTSVGVKFSTYAVPMIIGEIRRYLRDNSSYRIPRSLRDIAYKAMQAKERLAESPDVLERLNEAWAMERKNKLELLTARNNQAQIVPRHRSKWIRTGIRAAIVPFVIFCIMALFLMPRAYIQMSERMNGTDVVRFLVTSILAIVLCFVIGYVFARLIDQNKADGIRKERADAERLERELAAKGEQLHEVRTGYQLQDTKRREIQSDVNAREDLVAQTIYKLQVMEEAMRMLE